jgi:isocitrate dehydrogenase
VDVFIHMRDGTADDLARRVHAVSGDDLRLTTIANRGVKVYPGGDPGTFCVDQWGCRFMAAQGGTVTPIQVVSLLQRLAGAGLDFVKTEHLYNFDGERAYSLGQGE